MCYPFPVATLECPWCRASGARTLLGPCWGLRCACGAVLLGAPAADFDEVIDQAINEFSLFQDFMREGKRLGNLGRQAWLERKGVEVLEMGGSEPAGPLGPTRYFAFRKLPST